MLKIGFYATTTFLCNLENKLQHELTGCHLLYWP